MRRCSLVPSVVVLVKVTICLAVVDDRTSAAGGQGSLERARRIHAGVIGVDSHIDTLQRVLNGREDISRRSGRGHVDLPRLRDVGIRAPFFALYVPTHYKGSEAVRRTLQLRDAMQSVLDAHPDQIELALSASDIERIARTGRIAAVLTIESGHAIADNLAVLRMYHRLGIRSMTLSHFRNTNWADSSTDTPEHNGPDRFRPGRRAGNEPHRHDRGHLARVGQDLLRHDRGEHQTGDRLAFELPRADRRPAEHDGRHDPDAGEEPRRHRHQLWRELSQPERGRSVAQELRSTSRPRSRPYRPGARRVRDEGLSRHVLDDQAQPVDAAGCGRHIGHVVKLVGIDHVGIGSDWDGISTVPAGLEDVSKMPALTAALLERGYSEQDVKKILGGNFLRVMREAIGR